MRVKIGALKNELSRYLRRVRLGEEITITDRNEPVAKLIPMVRTLVRADLKLWLKQNPPVKASKKQISSAELLRKIRDEE